MEPFYAQMVKALPALRTNLAYGFALLVVLSFIYVHTQPNTPVIPQIFIFAVVPLLIAMVLIGKELPAVYQFILIFTITVMCLAFLGTGVVLAAGDKTSVQEATYAAQIYPVESNLNQRYLVDHKDEIAQVKNYGQYRSLILRVADTDTSEELKTGFETIINYYQGYITCRAELQCLGSPQFDGRIRDFWYTFRPIIEERRNGLWEADYGKSLQEYAESVRPPLYLSAVRRDPVTGLTSLINTTPQLPWTQRLPALIWARFGELRDRLGDLANA